MQSEFGWGTAATDSPWSHLDGPGLASSIGALQLLEENQTSPLKLHVLASIAVGLPERSGTVPIGRDQLVGLLELPVLQDPEGTGEFEVTDLFCNEVDLLRVPFRFLAGSAPSAHSKMEFLAQSILTNAGKDLPAKFLEPAAELIFAVAQLSEMVCARARIDRTRLPISQAADTALVPSTSVLRALEDAVRHSLNIFNDQMLSALLPLTSKSGDQFDVYPGHAADVIAVKPLLRTETDLIVVCPGELAGALTVQLQVMAAQLGCLPELATAHRNYVSAYVHDLVSAGPMDFDSPIPHADLGIDLISGNLQGQSIHIIVEVDPLNGFDPAEPFGIWFVPNRSDHIVSLIPPVLKAPPVVIHCTLSSSRGQARMGVGIEGVHVLFLEVPDLITLLKLKWNDHPWDIVRFARAVRKLETTTQIFGESLLGEYGVYDDHRESFYLSDEQLPTMLMIGGQYSLKYRSAERAKFDEHLVPAPNGAIRSVSLSGVNFAPIYMLFERIPALSIELDDLFIWIRASSSGSGGPVDELLEGVSYWIWQIAEVLRVQIHHRELRVLLVVDMSDSGDFVEIQRVHGDEFRVKVRPAASLAFEPSSNSFDRSIVAALIKDMFQSIVEDHIDVADLVEEVAPLGNKRMFLIGSNSVPELSDPRVAGLSRTVPESLTAEVLDDVGQRLFASEKYPIGDIEPERTTEVLNEAVALYYRRLVELIARYDSENLIERLMGQSAGLEVVTRLEGMRRLSRIACYGSRHYPPSKLRREDNERVEASIGVRFLIELISAIRSEGSAIPNDDEYDLLTALAVEIVSKGMQSDASHYGLSDVRTSRLGSGRLGTTQDDRWAIGLVEHSELMISRLLQGEPDRNEVVGGWGFSEREELAFTAEFGFTVREMQIGLVALYEDLPRDKDTPAVVRASRPKTVAAMVSRTSWAPERASSLLDLYTLNRAADFVLDGESSPWRYGRVRSYIRRPVVAIDDSPDGLLRWSPSRPLSAIADLVTLYRTGRLKAQSKEMKIALGSVRQASNLAFERRVASRYRELGYTDVFERVTSWAGAPLRDTDGSDLGDIDVLVIDSAGSIILVVEAKDFEAARTPIEISREMAKLRNEAVKKSHRRARWVREHLHLFPKPATGWVVEEVVVTSRRSTAAATGNGHETVIAFDDLRGRGTDG